MKIRSAWTLGRGFASMGRYATLCWSPDDPPAPPPPPTPPAPPTTPFAVFPTQASFDERMDRRARELMKEKFGLSEAELDKRLKRAAELEAAEAERKKQQQTKEEQLEGEKKAAEAKAAQAELDAAAARREAETTKICARLGVKNVDYALYEAGRSGKTGPDLEAHFAEMLKDDGKKGALGLAVEPPTSVPVPINTSPIGATGTNAPPPPPPGGTGAAPPPDVMKMSSQDFAAHLSRLGTG